MGKSARQLSARVARTVEIHQAARSLYRSGRMHDALEAAQAACEHSPRDPDAWALLARIARRCGLPASAEDAFQRAAALSPQHPVPVRMSAEQFDALVQATLATLPDGLRSRLRGMVIEEVMPSLDLVTAGLDPDALTSLSEPNPGHLVLYRENFENAAGGLAAVAQLLKVTLQNG